MYILQISKYCLITKHNFTKQIRLFSKQEPYFGMSVKKIYYFFYGKREVSSDFVLQTSDFVLQTSDFVLQTLYFKVGMDIVTHFRFQFYNNKMDNIAMQ